jgi:hypothetical protein
VKGVNAFSESASARAYATFELEMQVVKESLRGYPALNGVKSMSANSANEQAYAAPGQQQDKNPSQEYPRKKQPCGGDDHASCATLPDFKRLNYFYGQMLGVADFQTEQNYFREKLKLHNRCLHGYGVVCGLKVVPEELPKNCVPKSDEQVQDLQEQIKSYEERLLKAREAASHGDQAAAEEVTRLEAAIEELRRQIKKIRTEDCDEEIPTRVIINCGLALDCEGNELVVGHEFSVDLWRYLNRADRERVRDGEHTIYLSICYCPQHTDPARAVLSDECGAANECAHGRVRDAVKVRLTVEPPKPDERCATCCEACEDSCVLLARIDDFYRGWPIEAEAIHNEVRRPVTTYQPTTITGISWTDGAEYTENEAEALMGTNPNDLPASDPDRPKGYLMATFSRPVLTSTIKRGVVDVFVVEGGGGRKSAFFNVEVEYVDLPAQSTTDRVRFRVVSDESPNPGDRVMIFIRAPRILDECCRPLDGANTGGRTPFVTDDEFKEFQRPVEINECVSPPPFCYGPWTSGTGVAGANFESWFYIKANPKNDYKKK